jgi:hypothetical protein
MLRAPLAALLLTLAAQAHVRVLSYTHAAAAGGSVVAAASVTGGAAACSGTLRDGASTVHATARVASHRVSLRWSVPASAPAAGASLTIACPGSGSATVHVKIAGVPVQAAVRVDKSGFTASTDFGVIDYGAVLTNPSGTQDALNVQMTATFSAAGQVVATDTYTLPDVPAGSTFSYGGFAPFSAGTPVPTTMQLTALVGSRQRAAHAPTPPVTSLQVTHDDFLGTEIQGQLSNPYAKTLSTSTAITYVFFNKAGKVISGGITFASAPVPPHGQLAFQDYDVSLAASSVASISASLSPDFG